MPSSCSAPACTEARFESGQDKNAFAFAAAAIRPAVCRQALFLKLVCSLTQACCTLPGLHSGSRFRLCKDSDWDFFVGICSTAVEAADMPHRFAAGEAAGCVTVAAATAPAADATAAAQAAPAAPAAAARGLCNSRRRCNGRRPCSSAGGRWAREAADCATATDATTAAAATAAAAVKAVAAAAAPAAIRRALSAVELLGCCRWPMCSSAHAAAAAAHWCTAGWLLAANALQRRPLHTVAATHWHVVRRCAPRAERLYSCRRALRGSTRAAAAACSCTGAAVVCSRAGASGLLQAIPPPPSAGPLRTVTLRKHSLRAAAGGRCTAAPERPLPLPPLAAALCPRAAAAGRSAAAPAPPPPLTHFASGALEQLQAAAPQRRRRCCRRRRTLARYVPMRSACGVPGSYKRPLCSGARATATVAAHIPRGTPKRSVSTASGLLRPGTLQRRRRRRHPLIRGASVGPGGCRRAGLHSEFRWPPTGLLYAGPGAGGRTTRHGCHCGCVLLGHAPKHCSKTTRHALAPPRRQYPRPPGCRRSRAGGAAGAPVTASH